MSLIICPECGREISDLAKKCPHCGAPIKRNPLFMDIKDLKFNNSVGFSIKRVSKLVLFFAVIIIVLYIIIMITSNNNDTKAVNDYGSISSSDYSYSVNTDSETTTDESTTEEPTTKPFNPDDYNTGITYDNLARTPDEYEGKYVKLSGEVVQAVESTGVVAFRVAVDGDYDHIVYVEYYSNHSSERILESDTITVYGVSIGLYTYTSTLGSSITIPGLYAEKIERVK